MRKTITIGVLSVPAEALPYKYNEQAECTRDLRFKIFDLFVQTAAENNADIRVMSSGEVGFSLWSLDIARAADLIGHPVRPYSFLLRMEQQLCWAMEWRERYERIRVSSVNVIDLYKKYPDGFKSREDFFSTADRYVVDNSDFLIAVAAGKELPSEIGYAKSSGKQITVLNIEDFT